MNNTPYIGFWKRAVAFVIDGFLCSLPPAVICLPLLWWQAAKMTQAEGTDAEAVHFVAVIGIYVLWQALGLLCFWLYFAFQESGSKQATFGKRIMGIKVIGADGGRISFARATGRTFSKMVSYAVMYVGFIMAGLTNRKRALHDYIAQTYVVRADFRPGDELPDTPAHPVWLGIITGVLGLLFVVAVFLSVSRTAVTLQAGAAEQQLQSFAAERTRLAGPQETNGITYFQRKDGYRAVIKDWEAEDYTLFLPAGGDEVCCETAPNGDCTPTGFEACK